MSQVSFDFGKFMKITGFVIMIVAAAVNVAFAGFNVYDHITDQSRHLTPEEKSVIQHHIKLKDIHRTVTEDQELFVTRREYDNLKREIESRKQELNNTIDKLEDLLIKYSTTNKGESR